MSYLLVLYKVVHRDLAEMGASALYEILSYKSLSRASTVLQ